MVKEGTPALDESKRKIFNSFFARLLWVGVRTRPDIFWLSLLGKRTAKSDQDDRIKLKQLLQYFLQDTRNMPLTLGIKGLQVVKWWTDAAFAVYPNMMRRLKKINYVPCYFWVGGKSPGPKSILIASLWRLSFEYPSRSHRRWHQQCHDNPRSHPSNPIWCPSPPLSTKIHSSPCPWESFDHIYQVQDRVVDCRLP